jgi:preprotein translocase subunit SecE
VIALSGLNGSDCIFLMARTSPGLFVRQVRQEISKVTWPSRRETTISVILVFIFSAIIGIYFLIIDRILTFGISLIFG